MCGRRPSTARRRPAAFWSSADTTVQTGARVELIDLTDRIAAVRESGVREGIVSLWSLHTTFAVFMNEAQPALHADIKRLLETLVARGARLDAQRPRSFRLRSLQR